MNEERVNEEWKSVTDLGSGEHNGKMQKIVAEMVCAHNEKREELCGHESNKYGSTGKEERKTKQEME